jgi:hypothetical protein
MLPWKTLVICRLNHHALPQKNAFGSFVSYRQNKPNRAVPQRLNTIRRSFAKKIQPASFVHKSPAPSPAAGYADCRKRLRTPNI